MSVNGRNGTIRPFTDTANAAVLDRPVAVSVHTGPVFGKPPTGKSVSLASTRIDHFAAGKIAEHWSVAAMTGFLQQLQATP